MDALDHLKSKIDAIEKKLGIHFTHPEHLILAFIHPSYANEHPGIENNQRLEFLGDSVLNLVTTAFLYHRFPDLSEGELSNYRSVLVDAQACASYVKRLYIEDNILLSKGERLHFERGSHSMLADLFESLVGACFLDGGFEKAKSFILMHFESEMEKYLEDPPRNWKADLQDYAQKKFKRLPKYLVVKEEGPDHAKIFCVKVSMDRFHAIGTGMSKKVAQQKAAKALMEQIENGQA